MPQEDYFSPGLSSNVRDTSPNGTTDSSRSRRTQRLYAPQNLSNLSSTGCRTVVSSQRRAIFGFSYPSNPIGRRKCLPKIARRYASPWPPIGDLGSACQFLSSLTGRRTVRREQ